VLFRSLLSACKVANQKSNLALELRLELCQLRTLTLTISELLRPSCEGILCLAKPQRKLLLGAFCLTQLLLSAHELAIQDSNLVLKLAVVLQQPRNLTRSVFVILY
jgi:hypothetical protein